jgi:hypothetical protein
MLVSVYISFEAEDQAEVEDVIRDWTLPEGASVSVNFVPAPQVAVIEEGNIVSLEPVTPPSTPETPAEQE